MARSRWPLVWHATPPRQQPQQQPARPQELSHVEPHAQWGAQPRISILRVVAIQRRQQPPSLPHTPAAESSIWLARALPQPPACIWVEAEQQPVQPRAAKEEQVEVQAAKQIDEQAASGPLAPAPALTRVAEACVSR